MYHVKLQSDFVLWFGPLKHYTDCDVEPQTYERCRDDYAQAVAPENRQPKAPGRHENKGHPSAEFWHDDGEGDSSLLSVAGLVPEILHMDGGCD